MHTARLLPVSPSMHWAGGGGLLTGGLLLAGSAPGGGLLPGGLLPGGLLPGGLLPGGVSQHAMMQWGRTCLWTEFLTHTTENITLPQLRCGN